ncbi:hypothetical protein HanRHA438_Chr09g0377551 [Helianthus annuus]|uniref:Uncharacterized protein n=1 Tax=Helianthus annuus TaxID=4232 RepID=A0A251TSI9_HELAN|nr:hypothetical protein HanXRQr2_Chr09g0366491 [Helianthus annuus]KAJ0540819.1 hypothetical protein HanHA89_Chr09g0321161 [Helianthus annuus]KAJ0886283.1 hypothetical protein HanRHA438_Chr09g0377551 [Helianthus annuus]KAJ0891390.1 hypothetical protein HanPSC8_Chr09g0353171 [Helianthus annuus]
MYVYFTLFLVSIYVNKNTNPQYPSEERSIRPSSSLIRFLSKPLEIKATGKLASDPSYTQPELSMPHFS